MFQKLKPVEDNAAMTPISTQANPTEQKMESTMNETTSSNTTTDTNELSDLRSSSTPTTAYSPRPAATAGFSTFPSRPMGSTTPATPSTTSTYGAPSTTDGRRLVIGEGINISGEIDACNHLVVEGQVEATLKGANILDIAESGTFYGSVEINEGTIAGRFEGDLKVDGRLTIRSTGIIIGSLSYRELAVESGATIEGKITPLNSKGSTRGTAPKSTSTAPAQKRPTVDNNNELPFATKAAS